MIIIHDELAHLKDKVKMPVRVPLDREGLERARPLVSRIYHNDNQGC